MVIGFLAFRITMVTTCYNRLMISYVSFEDDEHEDGSNMFQRYKDVLIRRQWMEVQCSISQSIFSKVLQLSIEDAIGLWNAVRIKTAGSSTAGKCRNVRCFCCPNLHA